MKRVLIIVVIIALLTTIGSVVPVYYRHYMVQNFLEDAAHYAVVEKSNEKVAQYFTTLLKEEGIDAKIRESMLGIKDLQYKIGVVRTFTMVEVRFDYYEVLEIPYVNFRHQFNFVDVASWQID